MNSLTKVCGTEIRVQGSLVRIARLEAEKYHFLDNPEIVLAELRNCGVRIDFSRPGKPTDNAYVESFNGTFRAECLDAHWFATLTEVKQVIEAWRREYNESRPHRALGERTPHEIAHEFAASREFMDTKTAGDSLCA